MSLRSDITTRAIVLLRTSAGEGSVRVLLYTETLGLVIALATSAREERSKLRSHLQVGTLGTFSLVRGRDVWRAVGATDTQNTYFTLSGRRKAQEAAARVLASVRQFVHGEGPDPYLFSVLSEFLSSVVSIEDSHVSGAECVAVLRILSALGYVREDSATKEFLSVSYDTATLARALGARPLLVRTVNEAIGASGL